MNPQAQGIYARDAGPRPLATHEQDDAINEIGEILNARGYALVPAHRKGHRDDEPRVLTLAQIRRLAPLRRIAEQLPPAKRLWVVSWPDGSAILAATRREANPPPEAWLRKAHRACRALPTAEPPAWWPL